MPITTPEGVSDPINPSYYKRGGLEAADVIEAFGLNWRLGTAAKYLLRAGHKGDRIEDLKKCLWYINREIANQENAEGVTNSPEGELKT